VKGQRAVDAEPVARDGARDELERVTGAGAAEGRLDDDLAALAGTVGIEQRERALEQLEADGGPAGRPWPW